MVFLLIALAIVAGIDLIPLIRQRSKRGILAFLLLFLPALTLGILQAGGVEVPSVMLGLGKVVRSLGLNY